MKMEKKLDPERGASLACPLFDPLGTFLWIQEGDFFFFIKL